ncbi:helix-turn-helix domain-containing protein [Candidatus Thiodictyon syntrophicum]|jgi:HTH-type transcriptional regulator/antitoxin HigA|uniref:Transcriptional regulator n=1 Tax=Candidatus Thiodictyon syntrophicum TaxID=1166950 RepID=A0A2K8UBU1_9GAMM|nr:transcriptional regulator [Candidatus Thiodictyon syntrophicum]AUB83036.1 transcriptional regulator [Candidatus Thiodictyon syntrophicum]
MNRVEEAIAHWPYVAPLLRPPSTDGEYLEVVKTLDAVLDAGGADESHPLAALAQQIGETVAEWERRDPMPESADGAAMLRHLMDVHGLRQSDLPEIGAQSVVSAILAGRRSLNVRQVKALAARFGIPAANFL